MNTSYYYKYNFISPEPIFTKVKEELKSYFSTGVIDDILFPTYMENCLSKLGRSSYKIVENVFQIEDYETRLPDNFYAVRELWLTTAHDQSFKMPNSCYEQATVLVNPERDRCHPGNFCAPKEIKLTYKTSGTIIQRFTCHHLLKPGNVHARENCSMDSFNIFSDSFETFDLRNGKLITNFPEGTVYLVYYIKEYDKNDYQLVPDNERIKDYLENYLKYKCFENIWNNVSDESTKMIEGKMIYYERKSDECRVMAESEIKRQTIEQSIRAAKAAKNRFNKYNIT